MPALGYYAELEVGDAVRVYSRSSDVWARDGAVVRVLKEAIAEDGRELPAGSVKVLYNGNEAAKWVPPASIAEELQAADFEASDSVAVYSRGLEAWVADGTVDEVLREDMHIDGIDFPAGSVKVIYANKESAKWVPPAAFGKELKAVREWNPDDVDAAYGVDAAGAPVAQQGQATTYVVPKGSGAAGAFAGRYRRVSEHNEHPKFRNSAGAIMFFDGHWKMNNKDDVLAWCYEVKGSDAKEPPAGKWGPYKFWSKDCPPVEVLLCTDPEDGA